MPRHARFTPKQRALDESSHRQSQFPKIPMISSRLFSGLGLNPFQSLYVDPAAAWREERLVLE